MRRTRVAVAVVALALLWCVLACVPALADTGSTSCKDISCFAWDYMDLGEANGWWAKWFPACAADNQSPIDIDDTKVKHTTDRITITPVNGKPFGYSYVMVSAHSLFNVLEYSILGRDLRVNIVRESASAAETKQSKSNATLSAPSYIMSSLRVQFPAEHTINGVRADAEIHYIFQIVHFKDNMSNQINTATADGQITTPNVILVLLLRGDDYSPSTPSLENALNQVINGANGGSGYKQNFIANFSSVYVYTGSLSYPPCTSNVLYVVGTNVMSIQASTMQALRALNVSGMGTREVKSVGERVVELLGFDAKALAPVFRTTPSPVRYRLKSGDNDYSIIFFRGYVIYLVLVNILLFLMLLWLLWERVSYSYRYNLTWRRPTTGQGVFGAAVRYGRETGATKLRRGRRPAAAESHNSAAADVTAAASAVGAAPRE